MRKLTTVILAGLLVAACIVPVFAWEFSMNGEVELRYRYVSRTGPNDLFGNADAAQTFSADGISIGLAGPNRNQVRVQGYSAKGSDAAYAEQRFETTLRLKVNRAIRVRGIVGLQGNLNGLYKVERIGRSAPPPAVMLPPSRTSENWGTNPQYSGWIMNDSRDIVNGVGLAVPVVRALWTTIESPWGILIFGRRPAGFGLGWVLHEDDVYARSLSLVVPFGPLTFVFSQYLHDNGEDIDPNDERTRYGMGPPAGYNLSSAVDQNEVIDWNQAVAVLYRRANLDLGAMARIIRWNNVHELSQQLEWLDSDLTNADDAVRAFMTGEFVDAGGLWQQLSLFLGDYRLGSSPLPIHGDMFFLLGSTYLKYSSGPWFLNAEYDFQLIEIRRQGGRPVSGFPQAWALESGMLAGPLKLSLAHFYRSGHDRRGGIFYPASARGNYGIYDKFQAFLTAWGGGQGPIAPYNFLLGLYGTGNNSYNASGQCTYADFLAYAGRLDYALAANLSVFGSFIYARRASNTATPRGFYQGYTDGERMGSILPWSSVYRVPNVPDDNLGWEVDLGCKWKLLENLTLDFLFAYWQPGDWFKAAYANYSAFDFGGASDDDWNPDRTIDPLIGIQTGLLVEF